MGERALTVRDKIIIHLFPYQKFSEDFECPEEMCQAGISAAIGKSRAHVTLELGRMLDAGLLHERVAHVKGAKSKRKTYTLTATGIDRGRQITDHLKGLEIEMRGTTGPARTTGYRAAEALMDERSVSRAIAYQMVLACGGVIDMGEHRARPIPGILIETPDHFSGASEEDGHSELDASDALDAHVLWANILSKKGDLEGAFAVLGKALRIFVSDPGRSRLHYSLASNLRKQGNLPAALTEINRALALARDSGDALTEGRCLMEKAMILHGAGKGGQSLKLLGSAGNIFRREDSQVDILRCELNLGMVLRGMGRLPEARDVLVGALELAEKTGLDRMKAHALVNLADLLNGLGEFSRSKKMGKRAVDIFRVLDEPLMLAAALFNLGAAQAGLGEKKEALANLDRSISILEKNGMLASRTDWLEKYAAILEENGEAEKARAVLEKI